MKIVNIFFISIAFINFANATDNSKKEESHDRKASFENSTAAALIAARIKGDSGRASLGAGSREIHKPGDVKDKHERTQSLTELGAAFKGFLALTTTTDKDGKACEAEEGSKPQRGTQSLRALRVSGELMLLIQDTESIVRDKQNNLTDDEIAATQSALAEARKSLNAKASDEVNKAISKLMKDCPKSVQEILHKTIIIRGIKVLI